MPDLPEPGPGWRVIIGRETRLCYQIAVGYPKCKLPCALHDPTPTKETS